MKPGGRCGYRSGMMGINGLIAFQIPFRKTVIPAISFYIGRKGHRAEFLQYPIKGSFKNKADHSRPIGTRRQYFPLQAETEIQPFAGTNFSPGLNETGGRIGIEDRTGRAIQDQAFHPASALLFSLQPCRDHTGIVDHQHITGIQIFNDLIKNMVFPIARLPIQNQKPGMIPLCTGFLGD